MSRKRSAAAAPRRGFSLIELLIVIAIIGVIASIAIPLLLSARRNALDEKARACVRTVLTAQQTYYAQYSRFGDFDELSLDTPPFLDARFAGNAADLGHGIEITLELGADGQHFTVTAENPAGSTSYSGDETNQITELE